MTSEEMRLYTKAEQAMFGRFIAYLQRGGDWHPRLPEYLAARGPDRFDKNTALEGKP